MSDIQGGTDWELREAENAIIAAETPEQRALAMRRHAEAQRNMMQGVLVPMFVKMVEHTLGPMIGDVGSKVDGLHVEMQRLAGETATRLGKIERAHRALNKRHGAQIKDVMARLDRKRHELDDIHDELHVLQAFKTDIEERISRMIPEAETRDLIAMLRRMAAAEHGDGE